MNREGLIVTITAAIIWFVFSKSLKKNKNRGIPPIIPTPILSNNTESDPLLSGQYEVFLSFCGKDTRKGFTDFLYTYLRGAGIRTFRDNEGLHVGEEIGLELLKAIKESKISIPVFSRNYASSKWCLLELALMVECQANGGQVIFPIFYDVDPHEVRHQSGSYKEAFRRYNQKPFDKRIVQGWKETLTKVGQMKGLELKEETGGHEGELVKKVVEMVLSKLKKNYTDVSDNLVGMDERIKEMEELLDVGSNGVRIVGIHGMGGLGKTTIAKLIYNHVCERFECCCFLDNVQENSQQRNGIVNLQNQLLSKIQNKKISDIVDVSDGINRIKDAVHGKKVFIVLDDVDENSQFDKLAGSCDWFASGSRIIVTTRNKKVLASLETVYQQKGLLDVCRIYEPQFMNFDDSLQLFSKYAFMRDDPKEGYHSLAEDIVSTAAGLPLVLVTIGSLLFGEDNKALWEEKWRELQEIPDKEVRGKLKISFEALTHEEQQIFLDIACLFIGHDKTYACYMWEDCKYYPRNGMNVLVLRSLIKVGDDNTLRMHDQLRDLGRHIVREESLTRAGGRSRLWQEQEGLDLFEIGMVPENVVALNLDCCSERVVEMIFQPEPSCMCSFVGQDFRKLPNLRFLKLGFAYLDGDFKHLLSNLRWLEWGCWWRFTPTNFHLKNLVILDMWHSNITDDWEGWSQFKAAKKLKVLDLSYCRGIRRGPNFSSFTTLEILILRHSMGLEELNPTIGNLINLKVLDLSYCPLRTLNCVDVHSSELLGLQRLESLTYLNTLNCWELKRLPDLSNLKKLKKLEIRKCTLLTEIQGLDKLECLEHLDMSECAFIGQLPDISNLRMLKEVSLCRCFFLSEIEGLEGLESLESLDLSHCNSLSKALDLSRLENLKKLKLQSLKNLTQITGIEELKSLELLDFSSCRLIENFPGLSNLVNLKEIYANNCKKLTEIRGLEKLKSLKVLCIIRCESLENLPYLPNTSILRTSEDSNSYEDYNSYEDNNSYVDINSFEGYNSNEDNDSYVDNNSFKDYNSNEDYNS